MTILVVGERKPIYVETCSPEKSKGNIVAQILNRNFDLRNMGRAAFLCPPREKVFKTNNCVRPLRYVMV